MAPRASLVNFKHEHGPPGNANRPTARAPHEKLPHRDRTNPTVLAHARGPESRLRRPFPLTRRLLRGSLSSPGRQRLGQLPTQRHGRTPPSHSGPRPSPGRLPAGPGRFWAACYSMGETTGAAPPQRRPAGHAGPSMLPPAAPNGASTTEPACPPTSQRLPYTSGAGHHDASDGGTLPGARSARSPDRMDAQAISHVSQDLQGLPVGFGLLLGRRSAHRELCHSCELFGV